MKILSARIVRTDFYIRLLEVAITILATPLVHFPHCGSQIYPLIKCAWIFHFYSLLCLSFNRYRDPCSESLNEDDNHTITLVGNANKRAVTLAKTCEQGNELRDCRAPRDWSILALQNTRTGKSHYLVICKCPSHFRLGKYTKLITIAMHVSNEVNAC